MSRTASDSERQKCSVSMVCQSEPGAGLLRVRTARMQCGEETQRSERVRATVSEKRKGRVHHARVPSQPSYVNWRAISHARGNSRAHDPATR